MCMCDIGCVWTLYKKRQNASFACDSPSGAQPHASAGRPPAGVLAARRVKAAAASAGQLMKGSSSHIQSPRPRGYFHELAKSPLWHEAREEEHHVAQHLAQIGRQASEIIGTRAQVLAAIYLQDRWRRHRRHIRKITTKEKDARAAAPTSPESESDASAFSEEDEVIEVEVVVSLDDYCEDYDYGDRTASRSIASSQPAMAAASAAVLAPAAATIAPPAAPASLAAPATPATPSTPKTPSGSSEMGSAAKEMVVARSVDDVFAVVSDFENYPKWVSGLQRVEVLERDEQSGIGKVVQFTCGAMGLSISYTLEYTMEPPGRLAWRSIAGGVRSIIGQYTLSPADAGADAGSRTRVHYKLDVDTGFKMPAMLRRTATSLVIGAALPDLKRHLEKDSAPKKSWWG
jgi:ribosome-associated toxin RatA of RatAB toxin-antitoxin module